jgi:hypothetical protein
MARDLDEVVLASKMRFEDMAAFIADLEAEAARQGRTPRPLRLVTPPPAPAPERTRKDLGLAWRMRTLGELFWGRRRRGAILASVLLVLLGMAAALGLQISVTPRRNVAQAAPSASVPPVVRPSSPVEPPAGLMCVDDQGR